MNIDITSNITPECKTLSLLVRILNILIKKFK